MLHKIHFIYIGIITAFVSFSGTKAQVLKAPAEYPKPELAWRHPYHQTLMMKLFLSSVDAETKDGEKMKMHDKGESKVVVDFEQALEVIKKVDNLTLGIPKIIYLVGWQYNGHDSKYPAWGEVNPKLKRPQDETALHSMRWLMEEAFKYNTTVSVHINMIDALDDSPLWEIYVENNIIARNTDGSLRDGMWGWIVSYAQEWATGYAQNRIDWICRMLPLEKAGTVHIDAFHTWSPHDAPGPLSPFLGFTVKQEEETQGKIFRYWDSKGIDLTCEASKWYRNSAFEGLQPAAWHADFSVEDYMRRPASYYSGGVDGSELGKLFGTSLHGEDIFKEDPQQLKGFLRQFCTQTLPWYYLNRLQRLEYMKDGAVQEVKFSEGVVSRLAGKEYTIKQDGRTMLQNGDVFMQALWTKTPSIIAYSTDGYTRKQWIFPSVWGDYRQVDIYQLTLDGTKLFQENVKVKNKKITLSIAADEAVLIIPKR